MTAVTEQVRGIGAHGDSVPVGAGVIAPRPAEGLDHPPSADPAPRSAAAPGKSGRHRGDRPVRSWPLILLAVPATVAVWSGWVRLGQMTGFGLVRPFPGLWDSFQVNTAITLPIGVEAYGAYALRAWLGSGSRTSDRTRRYARWSAIGSLLLGMAGQVAYHLLSEAGMARAPWSITTGVACLPVLLLGMAAALSHMLHADANGQGHDEPGQLAGTAGSSPGGSGRDDEAREPGPPRSGESGWASTARRADGMPGDDDRIDGEVTERLEVARITALQLTSTGMRVSRRTLRDAGLRGSNAELGALVRAVSAELAGDDADEQPAPQER